MNRVLRAWAVLLAVLLSTLAAAADLVIGLSADVTSIDPHVLNAAPNNGVADQIYGTLVLNDARQGQQPGLAESWRAIDETTWEFRLRRGVKLHDGSDFTAEDVAFTIDRPATLKGVGGQFSVFSRAVREKFVVDAHTIRLKTAAPYPNLPTDIAALPILSKRAAQNAQSPFVFDRSGKPLEKNPFKDVRVRKAISKAINRQVIVERVMEGMALPAGQFVPEGFFGYEPALKAEPFDPEGARKLLADAGYPNGFAITLHGPNNRYVNDDQIVQAVAQMLTRVGIQTRVETMPLAAYFPKGNKTEFSVALLGWGVSTGEASYPLRALVATNNAEKGFGNFNWARYSNAQLDKLIEQALATVDDAQREKLLREGQQLAFADQAVVPLHYQVNAWAARQGLVYTPRTDERTHAHLVRPQ